MRQIERLAFVWLLERVVRESLATLLVIGAVIAALLAGPVLWRDLARLVGR